MAFTLLQGTLFILVSILAAAALGGEYGWGTLRTVLTKGTGRWQFMLAKVLALMVTALAGLVVAAATVALSSLIIGLFGLEGDSLQGSAEWLDVPIKMGTLLFSFLPYVMLALLATALTSSTALGITAFVVYYLIETTASPILNNFDWFQRISEYLLSPNVTTVLQASYGEVSISINGSGDAAQPDILHAVLVLAAYTTRLRRVDVLRSSNAATSPAQRAVKRPQFIIAVKTAAVPAGSAPVAQVCNLRPLSFGPRMPEANIDPRLLTPAHYCRQGLLGLRDRSPPES